MLVPFSHCGWCGAEFIKHSHWPRTCIACNKLSYRNPLPVCVVLVPIQAGLLTVRRAIEPQRGQFALPGGFINWGETWQEAGARELEEETAISIPAAELDPFWFASAAEGVLLVFCVAPALKQLPEQWQPTAEADALHVLDNPEPLAFPLHSAAAERWFNQRRAYADTLGNA